MGKVLMDFGAVMAMWVRWVVWSWFLLCGFCLLLHYQLDAQANRNVQVPFAIDANVSPASTQTSRNICIQRAPILSVSSAPVAFLPPEKVRRAVRWTFVGCSGNNVSDAGRFLESIEQLFWNQWSPVLSTVRVLYFLLPYSALVTTMQCRNCKVSITGGTAG